MFRGKSVTVGVDAFGIGTSNGGLGRGGGPRSFGDGCRFGEGVVGGELWEGDRVGGGVGEFLGEGLAGAGGVVLVGHLAAAIEVEGGIVGVGKRVDEF